MNLTTKNAKDLISKDNTVSFGAALDILNSCDIKSYSTLCENSPYLFDFILDKSIKQLTLAVNSDNLKNTFEFAKIYDFSFANFIVDSWVKFANEDLTDELLNLFEFGSDEQKIHCAMYFEKINDPLALEFLNSFALSENEELAASCAKTLSRFGDTTLQDKIIQGISNYDDFEKLGALRFLINFSLKDNFDFILKNVLKSPFSSVLVQEILCKVNFPEISKKYSNDCALRLLDEFTSFMPEDVPSICLLDYCCFDFVKSLQNHGLDSYSTRVLLSIKRVLELVLSDNIYTFDYKKEDIGELKNFSHYLNDLSFNIDLIADELKQDNNRAIRCLDLICELKLEQFAQDVIDLAKTTRETAVLCECARVLAEFNKQDLLDNNLADNVSDSNAKALFLSYLN